MVHSSTDPTDGSAAVPEHWLTATVHFDDVMARLAGAPEAPSPFDEPEAFLRWCGEAEIGGHAPIPRYFAELRRGRHDLLVAFPEVPGRDAGAYRAWITVRGSAECGPAVEAIGPLPVPSPRPIPDYVQAGVNLIGLLDAELGVGEVARRVGTALRAAHVPHATVVHRGSGAGTRDGTTDEAPRFDVNIVCLNADSFPAFVQAFGPDLVTSRPTVGVWFWETSVFPSMFHSSFASVDELWVASDYIAGVLRAAAPADLVVRTFSLPIVVPEVDATFDPARVGVPPGRPFVLCSFDHLSIPDRKNPHAAVDAFVEAVAPDEGPVLLVKSVRGDQRPEVRDALRARARGRADILFFDGYLGARQNAALVARASAFVSLHRSEGYGLNLADALALGTPLVATGATGNLAFCSPDDSWLVPAVEVPVGPGQFPYDPDARWYEPDHDAAVRALRGVLDDPTAARSRADRARSRVLAAYSPERCGRELRDRVAALRVDRARTPELAAATPQAAPIAGGVQQLVSRMRAWRR
jgi:glycosyltransferase involved in cell wall biosynthesis